MAAFIADKYMNNLDSALVYYKMFINRFPSHSYSTASKFRLNEIRDFLIEETEFIDKLLIYNEAIYLLTEANDLDTSKALFATLSNRGNEGKYNFSISAKQIKDKINYFQSLTESIYNDDSLDVESQSLSYKDSLYYYASYSFETLLNNPDSADYYYNYVIKNFNSSKFFNKSMLGLYRIHKNKELLNRINTESYIDWDDTIVDKSFLIDNYVLDKIELVQKKKYLTKIQKYIDLIPSDSSLFSHEENKENNQLKSKSNQIPNIQDMKNMSNFKFDLNDPK